MSLKNRLRAANTSLPGRNQEIGANAQPTGLPTKTTHPRFKQENPVFTAPTATLFNLSSKMSVSHLSKTRSIAAPSNLHTKTGNRKLNRI